MGYTKPELSHSDGSCIYPYCTSSSDTLTGRAGKNAANWISHSITLFMHILLNGLLTCSMAYALTSSMAHPLTHSLTSQKHASHTHSLANHHSLTLWVKNMANYSSIMAHSLALAQIACLLHSFPNGISLTSIAHSLTNWVLLWVTSQWHASHTYSHTAPLTH